jgi:hypothetical protein
MTLGFLLALRGEKSRVTMEKIIPSPPMLTRLSSLGLRLAAVVVCSAPFQALAQLTPPEDVSGKNVTDLKQAIIDGTKKVLTFMSIIAVVIIVVAGIRFIISQGEEQEKEKAKKTITYALIGLIIIIISRAIVQFIFDIF